MLDPVGVQVLQLDLIVVQQTPEERVGRNRESALVEGHEGDDIAVGRPWRILTAGHKPLRRNSPPAENTMLDEPIKQPNRSTNRVVRGWSRLYGATGTEASKQQQACLFQLLPSHMQTHQPAAGSTMRQVSKRKPTACNHQAPGCMHSSHLRLEWEGQEATRTKP